MSGRILPGVVTRDAIYGGDGRIYGSTRVGVNPVSRRVRLMDRKTGILAREQFSLADGTYDFRDIDRSNEFLSLSHDHMRTYNAVVADMLTPERMAAQTPSGILYPSRAGGMSYQRALTVLGLHFDGANNSTTFTEVNGLDVSRFGNAKISTAVSKFGGASVLFDGTGDYLSVSDTAGFNLGSNNFTISLFFKLNATGIFQAFIAQRQTSGFNQAFTLFHGTGGSITFGISTNGSSYQTAANVSYSSDTTNIHHMAVVRNGNNMLVGIDGVFGSPGNVTGLSINNSTAPLTIGADIQGDGSYANMYIDDLFIVNGVALWTSNFTPPTTPFSDW